MSYNKMSYAFSEGLSELLEQLQDEDSVTRSVRRQLAIANIAKKVS